MKKKTLGIDYGEKRIGIAVSDDLYLTAQPVQTIEYKDINEAFRKMAEIAEERGVSKIVVGIPYTLSNKSSEKTKEVTEFIKSLSEVFTHLEITTWDERLTTSQAEKLMIEAGVSREKRKKKIDALAASIMLQSYMDYVNQIGSSKHEIKM